MDIVARRQLRLQSAALGPVRPVRRRRIRSAMFLVGAAVFALTGYSSHLLPAFARADADARIVSIWADGKKITSNSSARTVGEVLSREGVSLAQGDLVEPAVATSVQPGYFNVNVYRARPVVVVDGGRTHRLRSAYSNPRLIAQGAGLTLRPQDEVKTALSTEFAGARNLGVVVSVRRAVPFTVKADGVAKTHYAQPVSIGEALKQANVHLGPQDRVSVPLTSRLTTGMTVAVTRVAQVVTTKTETIPRPVRKVDEPSMLRGETEVKTEGADGKETLTYRVHYRDGIESGREKLGVSGRVEPKEKIILVGTRVLYGVSVEYWRPYVQTAAARYGVDANRMMRIMQCESNGNARALNSGYYAGGGHPTGLFQYLPSTWRNATSRFGSGSENIYDGEAQVRITAAKMSEDGFGEWACR